MIPKKICLRSANKIIILLVLFPMQLLYAESSLFETAIYNKLHDLNNMRQALAGTLAGHDTEINLDTFKQVCMPVGQELKSWAQKNKFQARQISKKNRNPDNALKPHDELVYDLFLADKKLQKYTVKNEQEPFGTYFYYRISVDKNCLYCHGNIKDRPRFIIEKYPQDKAHSFAVGDLRGVYSVFVPE